ncbi:MAG: pilin [Patescibacteria group bacterium]|jgi:hypothetical protein
MFKKLFIILILIFLIGTLIPQFSFAQYGLEEGQKIQGLSQTAPEIFVGQIIKTVLLLIGVILIVLIIYGGLTYATAMGNEQKIETGKKILVYAVIGTVIIALAYVITTFVMSALFPMQTTTSTQATKNQTETETQGQTQSQTPGQTDDNLHGQNITVNPLNQETCKKNGEKCLFSPSAKVEGQTLEIQGTAPVNICCAGSICDINTQSCIPKCAGNGESFVKETLVKREYIGCCQGLNRNEQTQTCERPKL